MDDFGWPFANIDPFPGADVDHLNHAEHLKDIYLKVAPDYTNRCVSLIHWHAPR